MKKIKFTCGIPTQAECVETQVEVNSQSSLTEEDCLSQEEVNTDVYTQLEKLWSESDLEALGELCLSYTLVGGKKIVKNVLLKFEEEICNLKTEAEQIKQEAFLDLDISDAGLDFECLQNQCDENIRTVRDLLQALITNSCLTP